MATLIFMGMFLSISDVASAYVGEVGLSVVQVEHGAKVIVLVNVSVPPEAESETTVSLRIVSQREMQERGPFELSPRQSHSEVVSIDGPVKSLTYVIMTYSNGGVESTKAALAVPTPSSASSPPAASAQSSYLLAGSSILGVAMGAFLGHAFSKRRESTQKAFEWQKMLYEKREPAVLEFLKSWDSSTSAQVFEEAFRRLKSNVPLRAAVLSEGDQLLAVLRNPQLNNDAKVVKVRMFRESIVEGLSSPDRAW